MAKRQLKFTATELMTMKAMIDQTYSDMKMVGYSVNDPEMVDVISLKAKFDQLGFVYVEAIGERQNIH